MIVDVRVQDLPALPALAGPHVVSWSYVLDAIFADAYHRRLASLFVAVPSRAIADEVEQRAELSPARSEATGTGVALLAGKNADAPTEPDYVLAFGRLAPAALRAVNTSTIRPANAYLSVFTWRARLLGVPIRLAAQLARPHAQDQALAAMRRAFAHAGYVPAYYHLHLRARAGAHAHGGSR